MSAGSCPICGRPRETAYRPFCSKRCGDIDLQRWLTGRYRIDGDLPDEDDPQALALRPAAEAEE